MRSLEGQLSTEGADNSARDNFLPEGVGGVTECSNIGLALAGYLVEAATRMASPTTARGSSGPTPCRWARSWR